MSFLTGLFTKVSSKTKKVITRSAMILSLLSLVVVPLATNGSLATDSTTPRFNFLKGDVEMLTAANATKGQADWADPVTGTNKADVGDEIVFRFYVHNGVLNSTAHNTTIRALLPNAASTQAKVLSSLASQETVAISDTVVDGTIVGTGNGFAQIDMNTAGRLEYVPDSTKIWRHNPEQWGVTIRDGITSNDGINIGAINGCWDFATYVTFKAVVKAPAQIAIDKYVAYPGTSTWNTILQNAKEGETVAWKIPVKNIGQSNAESVVVKDTLPSKLIYIPGSTVYYAPDAPAEGYQMPDGLTGAGLSINNLQPGDANVAYFVFQTKIGSDLVYGPGGISELVNTARATFGDQTVMDQAKVTVNGVAGMTVEKKVWNGTAWVEQNSAKLGDHIKYQITVKNTGQTTIQNIKIADVIPVYTSYIPGTTKLNGAIVADGIVSATGINVASLASGGSLVIQFEVKTLGCPPIGDYTITNTAYVSATGISSISDTAKTILSFLAAPAPSPSI